VVLSWYAMPERCKGPQALALETMTTGERPIKCKSR